MANGGKTGGRGLGWRERETLDLLSIWGGTEIQKALAHSQRNLDVFDHVSKQMAALGHKRSAVECRTKTKSLRHKYKCVVAHNSRSGNAPASCPFYGELDRILGGDAGIRPPQVAESLNLQVQVYPHLNQECAPGSEEFFYHDLETIKQEDIYHSVPLDSEPGESIGVWSQDPNEMLINQRTEEGVPPDTGETAEQENPDDGNNTTLQQDQDEQGTVPNAAELSPERRLSAARNRKRRVSMLSDVAHQMLRQSALDAERSQQLQREIFLEEKRCHQEAVAAESSRHEQMLSEENRRYEALLEEGRLERETFQQAMDKSYNLMFEAVTAIKEMTELMVLKHLGETPQVGNVDVMQENTSNNPGSPKPSTSNCPEKIPSTSINLQRARRKGDRLDL